MRIPNKSNRPIGRWPCVIIPTSKKANKTNKHRLSNSRRSATRTNCYPIKIRSDNTICSSSEAVAASRRHPTSSTTTTTTAAAPTTTTTARTHRRLRRTPHPLGDGTKRDRRPGPTRRRQRRPFSLRKISTRSFTVHSTIRSKSSNMSFEKNSEARVPPVRADFSTPPCTSTDSRACSTIPSLPTPAEGALAA